MGKKLFVLLILAMMLLTIVSLVLALTGHDDLLSAAGGWVAHSVAEVAETLGTIGVLILVVVVCSA